MKLSAAENVSCSRQKKNTVQFSDLNSVLRKKVCVLGERGYSVLTGE